jgi:cytochrome oxidase Cu insertion factor (SCO1/SenC/PrrC family)
MPKVMRLLIVAVLALFIATGIILVRQAGARRSDAAPPPPPAAAAGPVATPSDTARPSFDNLVIPEFSLIDHTGLPFSRKKLMGQVTIFDVVFTNCPLACPVMTEKMHALAEALSDTQVRFVSISIDPKRDTPARLREFRKIHDIDGLIATKWTHLTSEDGSRAYLKPIVEDGLKCAIEEDRSMPIKASDGTDMYNIRHPTWFFLLDGRGDKLKVVDIYQSTSDDEMKRLEADARRLVR